MTHNQLTFQFQLNHCNRLMHLHIKAEILGIVIRVIADGKDTAVCMLIGFQCKGCQRDKINTIPLFQRVQIAVSCSNTNHCCNTCCASAGSTHPRDIMISPLHINRMIIHQSIHDNMRSRSSVKNITDNMQMIHHKTLDQIGQCNDKLLSPSNSDNCMNNLIIIGLLIMYLCLFRNQFLDNIGKILRKCLTHLGSGIFGGNTLCNLDKPV